MKSNKILTFILFIPVISWANQVCLPNAFTPDYHNIEINNGIMIDHNTALEWKLCPLGTNYLDHNCVGEVKKYTWLNAMKSVEEYNDIEHSTWRVPNVKEITSITNYQCKNPAFSLMKDNDWLSKYINNTFWTSSFHKGVRFGDLDFSQAYTHSLKNGSLTSEHKESNYPVILVRDKK